MVPPLLLKCLWSGKTLSFGGEGTGKVLRNMSYPNNSSYARMDAPTAPKANIHIDATYQRLEAPVKAEKVLTPTHKGWSGCWWRQACTNGFFCGNKTIGTDLLAYSTALYTVACMGSLFAAISSLCIEGDPAARARQFFRCLCVVHLSSRFSSF